MKPGNKQLLFFFTPSELILVVEALETHCAVSYYPAGIFPSNEVIGTSSLAKEPSLGQLIIGDWNHSRSYLIAALNSPVATREIILRKGGSSYAIDQQLNPDTVLFKPSGVFDKNILVAGSIGTISNSPYSMKIFKELSKIIKQHSSKIGIFYVGSDAQRKLASGWRLVTNVLSPKEYDLSLE